VVRIPGINSSAPNGTARRLRQKTENPFPGTVIMTTVACYQCGVQFVIAHRSSCPDEALAARQAIWLADKLVWDHIQENNHPGSIPLPASHEMK